VLVFTTLEHLLTLLICKLATADADSSPFDCESVVCAAGGVVLPSFHPPSFPSPSFHPSILPLPPSSTLLTFTKGARVSVLHEHLFYLQDDQQFPVAYTMLTSFLALAKSFFGIPEIRPSVFTIFRSLRYGRVDEVKEGRGGDEKIKFN